MQQVEYEMRSERVTQKCSDVVKRLVALMLLGAALACNTTDSDDDGLLGPEFQAGALPFNTLSQCVPVNLADNALKPYVGNIWRPETATDEGFTDRWNQLTPEYAGKWANIEPVRGTQIWESLDAGYDYSRVNSIPWKYHTLVWGSSIPAWVKELDEEQQRIAVSLWFSAVGTRYSEIGQIDVVNEPLHSPPRFSGVFGGAGETGWDWVISLYELARVHFPNSELLLNDFNILAFDEATGDYLEIIDLLIQRDLIDGIGVQGHFLQGKDLRVIKANLDRLANTGLPVYVSELDVSMQDDLAQAAVYRDVFPLLYEHPAVAGITFWGWREGQHWQRYAHLMREDGSSRPSLDWLDCYLGR
ncbi:MAG: endo-1,4-beta-xylanase [Granulosicoccus sp.]